MARIEALAPPWIGARGEGAESVHPVVICGAGLSGLSIAFALKRRGVPALLIDACASGDEGPWKIARMARLRSPKTLSGLDLGVSSLTAQSWYEATHGAEAWESLERIDRKDWIDYLHWFRAAVGLAVENRTRLLSIEPHARGLALTLENEAGARRRVLCRRLVLATGFLGGGGPQIPQGVDALPRSVWAHSSEKIEPGDLAGKDVAILGVGSSSFDWAVAALRAKARAVTLFGRGPDLPRTEILAWTNFPGLLGSFAELPDRERWRFARGYFRFKMPPTQDQYDRACAYPNFEMKLGRPISSYAMAGDKVRLTTADGEALFDRLLLGTGYQIDLARRPELAGLVGRCGLLARSLPAAARRGGRVSGEPSLSRPRLRADAEARGRRMDVTRASVQSRRARQPRADQQRRHRPQIWRAAHCRRARPGAVHRGRAALS